MAECFYFLFEAELPKDFERKVILLVVRCLCDDSDVLVNLGPFTGENLNDGFQPPDSRIEKWGVDEKTQRNGSLGVELNPGKGGE
jgi:hypothetical protein